MPSRSSLTVVVPCYNESASLADFLSRLQKVLDGLPDFTHEIICIDDGSSDDTLAQLQ